MSDTTRDYPTPDPETFDFEAWLAIGDTSPTAGRGRETLTIYRDISLLDEAEKLAAEIEAAQASEQDGPGEDLAIGETSQLADLQARQEQLEAKIRAASATVEIVALSDAEMAELDEEYRQRHPDHKGQRPDTLENTCLALAKAATVNGAKLTPAQWEQLADVIAGGQWQKVKMSFVAAANQAPRVDTPFSRSGSNRRTRRRG